MAIALEGGLGPVAAPPVGLDDRALVAPDEVGSECRPILVGDDPHVDLGVGDAGGRAGGVHQLFQVRPGDGGAGFVLFADLAQRFGTRRFRMPGQEGVDGGGVQYSAHLGLIDGPFNTPAREHSGEVEDRAGDGGTRDAVHDRDVKGRSERSRAVDLDPLRPVTAAMGDRQLDAWAVGLAQLEEVGR